MEEELDKIEENKSDKQKDNRPAYWFKKGQSGNPAGRPKGVTLKEYCRNFLTCQTEEERAEFLEGIDKETIWKMAEGNPKTETDLTSGGKEIPQPIINVCQRGFTNTNEDIK